MRKQSKIRPRPRPNRKSRQLTGRGQTKNFTANSRMMPFSEDEYIAEITVANQPNFNCKQYAVNPGQVSTFPWLSTLAKNFEKYRFTNLEFYYKREVSEYATNGQVGKVMLSFDSDASDAAPSTKTQLEASCPHADGMPCENVSLVVPQRMLNRMTDGFYVRPGGLPGSADIKTYDIGVLNVATQGIVNNVAIGELHVRYSGYFEIPVIESTTTAPANYSVSWFQSTSAETSGSTTVATNLLLATATANGLSATNTSGSIVLAAGNYFIMAQAEFLNSVAGDIVYGALDIQVAGSSVLTQISKTWVAQQLENVSVSAFAFVSLNGSQALTFPATVSYTAGTQTQTGSVVIVAI